MPFGPFACIVQQVAHHLFQVLALTAKVQVRGHIHIDPDRTVPMHLAHRPRQIFDHRTDRCSGTDDLSASSRPCPCQIMIHMCAHGFGLLVDNISKLTGIALDLIGHHRQRCLERMGQITDLRAGAFHHLAIVLNQRIQFLRQWLDFSWKITVEFLRPAGADGRQCPLNLSQRSESNSHLNQERNHKTAAQSNQGPNQNGVKPRSLDIDLRLVPSHSNDVGLVCIGQPYLARDQAQALPVRAVHKAFLVLGGRRLQRKIKHRIPERPGIETAFIIQHVTGNPDRCHLPIPARKRFLKAQIADQPNVNDPALLVQLGRCHQAFPIGNQALIKPTNNCILENTGQGIPAHNQGKSAPERRAGDQPKSQ